MHNEIPQQTSEITFAPTNSKQTSTQSSGSKITSVYGEREVKVYSVLEPELTEISHFNTYSILLFSVASFFLSCAVKDGIFTDKGDFNMAILHTPIIYISIVLYLLGIWAFVVKSSTILKVKRESKQK